MPTIEFKTFDKDNKTFEYYKPVLAKKYLPEWWRNFPSRNGFMMEPTVTFRGCPAMQDLLATGWYIVLTKDVEVFHDTSGNRSTWQVIDPENNSHIGTPPHAQSQMHQDLHYATREDGVVQTAFKFKTGIGIITPPNYSIMMTDPFLFQHRDFSTWQGIMHTDYFNNALENCQVICYPKVENSFKIKAGTPIAQIIPYKREEWVASYTPRSVTNWVGEESGDDMGRFDDISINVSASDKLANHGMDDSESEEMRKQRRKQYRSKGVNVGKMFDECPYHKEDKDGS